jgi:hypothetical protein
MSIPIHNNVKFDNTKLFAGDGVDILDTGQLGYKIENWLQLQFDRMIFGNFQQP